MANSAVGHRKTMELTCEWLSSLYLLCPTTPFAIQLGEFCTMGPSHAEGLLLELRWQRNRYPTPPQLCLRPKTP